VSVPENEWRKTKETKDRKQFNSKNESNYNSSITKEGQCALAPEERPGILLKSCHYFFIFQNLNLESRESRDLL